MSRCPGPLRGFHQLRSPATCEREEACGVVVGERWATGRGGEGDEEGGDHDGDVCEGSVSMQSPHVGGSPLLAVARAPHEA